MPFFLQGIRDAQRTPMPQCLKSARRGSYCQCLPSEGRDRRLGHSQWAEALRLLCRALEEASSPAVGHKIWFGAIFPSHLRVTVTHVAKKEERTGTLVSAHCYLAKLLLWPAEVKAAQLDDWLCHLHGDSIDFFGIRVDRQFARNHQLPTFRDSLKHAVT